MAYTPNPDRKVVNGKAVVSAKELADFQAERGSDKTLRDLLNADKGLSRAPEFGVDKPRNPNAKDGSEVYRQGATYTKAPEPKAKADDSGPSEMVKGFREARNKFGDTPFVDALMDAGKVGMGLTGGKLLTKIPADLAAGIASSGALHAGLGALGYATASDQGKKEVRDMLGFKKGGAAKQYTKGGKINLGACGVSTHVPNKKNSNW
jgi:hypothetical protein